VPADDDAVAVLLALAVAPVRAAPVAVARAVLVTTPGRRRRRPCCRRPPLDGP
jgi:hypothetical protein